MADEYQVKITSQAQEQMQGIAHYIAFELRTPETAMRMLATLEKAITSLANYPGHIALTGEEPWHGHGVHIIPVKNYRVYFWIDRAAYKVQVMAVVYGKRAQVNHLLSGW